MMEILIGCKDIVSGVYVIETCISTFSSRFYLLMNVDSLILTYSIDKIRDIGPGKINIGLLKLPGRKQFLLYIILTRIIFSIFYRALTGNTYVQLFYISITS